MNEWMRSVLDVLLPQRCLLCSAPGTSDIPLCDACAGELPWNQIFCSRCAIPLVTGGICPRCQTEPPPFDLCLAPLRYEGPMRFLVHRLKFHSCLPAAVLLGGLIARRRACLGTPLPDVVLPVPLHRLRLQRRGFNQALEMARVAGPALSLPVRAGLCQRTRPTPAQSSLDSLKQRRRNLRNAFSAHGRVGVASVAVVDDVVTTGATVRELCLVLREAGVSRIEIWAGCRTPMVL